MMVMLIVMVKVMMMVMLIVINMATEEGTNPVSYRINTNHHATINKTFVTVVIIIVNITTIVTS